MKHRRVIVTLELETARQLSVLRYKPQWESWAGMKVHQLQANVIRPERAKRKARKKP